MVGSKTFLWFHLPFGFGSHEELKWPLAVDWNEVLSSNSSLVLAGCLILAWTRPLTACRELCGSSLQICSWMSQKCFWEWESIELNPSTLVARLLSRSSLFVWRDQGSGSHEHVWSTWQPSGARRARGDAAELFIIWLFFSQKNYMQYMHKVKKIFKHYQGVHSKSKSLSHP